MLKKTAKVAGVLLVLLVAAVLVINISVRGNNDSKNDDDDSSRESKQGSGSMQVKKQMPKPEVKKKMNAKTTKRSGSSGTGSSIGTISGNSSENIPSTTASISTSSPSTVPSAPVSTSTATPKSLRLNEDLKIAIMVAASTWNFEILKEFEETGAFSCVNEDGLSLLHQAASRIPESEEEKEKARETIKYLLRQGLNIDCTTADGYTPLMYAISKGNYPVSVMLIENGASIDSIIAEFEVNPLMLAVRQKNFRLVKMLLERGVDVFAYNKNGVSALQEAVIVGYSEGLEVILGFMEEERKVYLVNVQSPENQETLLHLATKLGNYEMVKVLVLNRKADRSMRDKQGKLAADYAKEMPDGANIRSIIEILEADEQKMQELNDEADAAWHERRDEANRKEMQAEQSKLKDEALARYRELGLI